MFSVKVIQIQTDKQVSEDSAEAVFLWAGELGELGETCSCSLPEAGGPVSDRPWEWSCPIRLYLGGEKKKERERKNPAILSLSHYAKVT